MDSSTITLIAIIGILILMSAFFSATETAFSSLNRIRLKNLAVAGNKRASMTLLLSENYDTLLSTILIGNNIVNIACASIATVLFTKHYGHVGVTISTIVMTIFLLLFGEISPKSLAKETPEKFAMFVTPLLKMFVFLLMPLNFLFMLWKRLLSKIFKVSEDRSITEQELLTIVEEAQSEGGINEQEGELIRSAIEFNDLDVSDVLTPRVDIIAIEMNDSNEEILDLFHEHRYSRLPVYKDSIDNIIGFIHQKDFYANLNSSIVSIDNIINPAVYVTKNIKISNLLRILQQSKNHMAVVSDEYGGTMGIVTLEDILEELVGEIWDEHDEVIEEFMQLDEKVYKISCNANLKKMFQLFNIDKEYDSTTVSGWVMIELGKFPKEGDSFEYESLKVTVLKTDSRRVLEIKVEIMS